jgi:hypothetical protein
MDQHSYYVENQLIYKIFNELPRIPEDMLQHALDHANEEQYDYYEKNVGRKSNPRTKDGVELGNKRFPRSGVPEELANWVREHISPNINEIGMAKAYADEHVDAVGPHTDRSRDYTMLYLLSGGGEDHQTVFYDTVEQIEITRKMNFDYNTIKEICRVQVPLKTWTLLYAQLPHSVENIPGERLAIQLGWQEEPIIK